MDIYFSQLIFYSHTAQFDSVNHQHKQQRFFQSNLFMYLLKMSRSSISDKKDCCGDSGELKEIHKLLTVITKITNHIETQNETIIKENRKLQDENSSLELQLNLLVQKNKEMNADVEQLIQQNKEFRDSLEQFKNENNRLRVELKQQNTKLRLVIESLKSENAKMKKDIDDGVRMLRWTSETKKSKKHFWNNLCPTVQ